MYTTSSSLADFDPEVWHAIQLEERRQEEHLALIASENYASPRVLRAQGSVLTNKYAEGYPAKRYYGGCEYVDRVEELAIERAKQLFGAAYANVQPHSGSQANSATYLALLQPGDVVLGQSLASGGHLTHGSSVNFSGKIYQAVQYEVEPDTGLLDYNKIADLAKKHQPKMLVAGFSAYAGIIDWQTLRHIADQVGAYFVADIAHVAGLVATGHYPSPVGIAHVVTTTTHKTLRGPRGGLILANDDPAIIKKLQSAVFPGTQGGPMMHVIAAKAVAFLEALSPEFKTYQGQVLNNAQVLATALMQKGIQLVTHGTKNHLLLLDLRNTAITGKEAEARLNQVNLVVNKNAVPGDPRPPTVTSGLRIGTPAATTRGLKQAEMLQLADWIAERILTEDNSARAHAIKEAVLALCQRFPVYTKDFI